MDDIAMEPLHPSATGAHGPPSSYRLSMTASDQSQGPPGGGSYRLSMSNGESYPSYGSVNYRASRSYDNAGYYEVEI